MLRLVKGRSPHPPLSPDYTNLFDTRAKYLLIIFSSVMFYVILLSGFRTFSQRESVVPPVLGAQGARAEQPYRQTATAFQWPTVINDPFTSRLRWYSLKEKADISGFWSRVPETFAQFKSDLTNHNFLTALGKYAVDDPSKLDRLALANLRENKTARNNLTSLHAARSCLYGSRGLGDKNWYRFSFEEPNATSPISFGPRS